MQYPYVRLVNDITVTVLSELGPEIDHAKVSEIPASIVCYFEEEPATLDLSVVCALVQEAYLHTDSVFTAASAAAWGDSFR